MKQILLRTVVSATAGLITLSAAWAQEEGAAEAEPAIELSGSDTIARVNGVDVLLSDILVAQQLLPGELASRDLGEIFPQLVDVVIEQRLYVDAAAAAGVADDPEFQARLKFMTERLLQDRYVDLLLAENVTQEAFDAEVEALSAQLGSPEQSTASHILIANAQGAEGPSDEARALAADLIARAQGGEDFAALATEFSDDPGSAAQGGSLGSFVRGQMVAEFEEAAFTQEIGVVSAEPIETRFGLHIILVSDRGTVEPNQQQVQQLALQRLEQNIITAESQKLIEAASIQRIGEDGTVPAAE